MIASVYYDVERTAFLNVICDHSKEYNECRTEIRDNLYSIFNPLKRNIVLEIFAETKYTESPFIPTFWF